jgi:hypothetical protein
MAGVERKLGALAKREQAARQRRFAIDSDQGFGADQVAGRPKQGVASLHGAHIDPVDRFSCMAKDFRIDHLDAAAIGAEAAITNDQRQSDRIDAQDQRPFLGDHVEKAFDSVGIDRGEHCIVDRGDSTGVATRESDQVLVRLLDRAEALPEVRDCALFEGNDRRHRGQDTPAGVKILFAQPKTKAAAPFGTAAPD